MFTLVLCFEFVVGQASAQILTPTPTAKAAQPTTDPTPTAQIPAPTKEVTTTPAPQTQVTQTPKASAQTQEVEPTTTPTPAPPTPTPKKLKPVVLPITKKPPVQPIAQAITAPFDLVMSALPYDYYNQQGLAPETTKVLLAVAFFSLLTGTFLLKWPALKRTARSLFAPKVKERKSFPYVTGSLTK